MVCRLPAGLEDPPPAAVAVRFVAASRPGVGEGPQFRPARQK